MSPCSTPATMSKKSLSPSGERTFAFVFKLDGNYTRMLRAILNKS